MVSPRERVLLISGPELTALFSSILVGFSAGRNPTHFSSLCKSILLIPNSCLFESAQPYLLLPLVARETASFYAPLPVLLLNFCAASAGTTTQRRQRSFGLPSFFTTRKAKAATWLPDGYSQIFRLYLFGPSGFMDYGSATLRFKICHLATLGCNAQRGRRWMLPDNNHWRSFVVR